METTKMSINRKQVKLWYIYSMEYCVHKKKGKLFNTQNGKILRYILSLKKHVKKH